MANPHLTAVSNDSQPQDAAAGEVYDFSRAAETGAQRIRRLQHEARVLAREQIEALSRDLRAIAERAAEVVGAGEVYPVGVRELASRMAEDLPQKAQVLLTIMERAAQG